MQSSKQSNIFQLKSMFPQATTSSIEELLTMYDGNLEFCMDALLQMNFDDPNPNNDNNNSKNLVVQSSNNNINNINSQEKSETRKNIDVLEQWKALQLKETFVNQPLEFIQKILIDCNDVCYSLI